MTLVSQIASVISAVTGIALLALGLRAVLREHRDDEDEDKPGGKHRKP